jgi:isoleucyl-tRNA synthetase
MSIGPTVIAQAHESLRKLRNTARFCLGNMGDRDRMAAMERVPRAEMGLVSAVGPFHRLEVYINYT